MRRVALFAAAAFALWLAPGALASGWCGTGESAADRPEAVTGAQVHAIWAVPSDGADTFAAGAPKLADDAASITSWWQGQDATRVPRFDLAVFGASTCLDISFVRLTEPAAAFTGVGATTAYNRLSADLAGAGFGGIWKKYYVYYDGPPVQTNVCGTGAGDFDSGPSFAVVWLAGCPSVPTDSVGAHELLHAFGALPAGALHPCPGDDGHPCDSTQDVLYPYNSGAPLSSLYLDYGHDDYYGHNGAWVDIQDSAWLHRLDLAQVTLAVAVSGAGHVVSDLPGIDCTGSCATSWDPGTRISLAPVPAPGWRFVKWIGDCANGGGADCSVDVTAPDSFSAVFGPVSVPVRVSVAGKGRIVCTPRCSSRFAAGHALTLRAVPAKNWTFTGWRGACSGKQLVCRPRTDFAVTARATFRKR